MGVETNVAPGKGCGVSVTESSPENPIGTSTPFATGAPGQSLTQGPLPHALVDDGSGSGGLLVIESEDNANVAPLSSSLLNFPTRISEETLSLPQLAEKTEHCNDAYVCGHDKSPQQSCNDSQDSTTTASESNYLINASESSATNKPYASSTSTSLFSNKISSDLPLSSTTAKHFRFSGDFTATFRGFAATHINTNVLAGAAFVSSSMVNLSEAWDEPTTPDLVSTQALLLQPHSPPSSSSNSILADLPTRFSFESSSTTSSSHSSSHLSLPQKTNTGQRRVYQRYHHGSFDRKDLTSLTNFQTHFENYGSFLSNRYGSVEKLTLRHDDPEPTKITETDVSSLSLSPINRKRDPLTSVRGPSISL